MWPIYCRASALGQCAWQPLQSWTGRAIHTPECARTREPTSIDKKRINGRLIRFPNSYNVLGGGTAWLRGNVTPLSSLGRRLVAASQTPLNEWRCAAMLSCKRFCQAARIHTSSTTFFRGGIDKPLPDPRLSLIGGSDKVENHL
jgi:hypothetical protein